MVLILRTCAVRGKHLEIPYLSVHALHYWMLILISVSFCICSPCVICVSINKQFVSFQNFLGVISRLLYQGRLTRLLLIFTNCIRTREQHFAQVLWVVRPWFMVS
jgi:hypothetical protein